MSDPYLGEIKMVSFGFAMQGWAFCNGQILSISQNQALFSLLGTAFGGDGVRTFGLPNLQARAPVGQGSEVPFGASGGSESQGLGSAEIPMHTHQAFATTGGPAAGNPAGNMWATLTATQNPYGGSGNAAMLPGAVKPAGSGQSHPNLQPYLTINFVIALVGVYPSRS